MAFVVLNWCLVRQLYIENLLLCNEVKIDLFKFVNGVLYLFTKHTTCNC